MGNWERQEERKRSKERRKEEKGYPNSRARPPRSGDCDSAWTSSLRKRATEVDYQVAAPTETSTPNLHRATSLTKSADGRVATEAAWFNGNNWKKKK
jgi:hypothetical protein